MARLYSARLLGGGATASLSATVPAGYRWVVRDAQLYFNGASTADVAQLLVVGVGYLMDVQATSGAAKVYQWEGRAVLNEADELVFGASTVNWYVLVSGYELTTP